MFLYNYAAILNREKLYEKSNTILNSCTKYLNDYDVQMIIADNFYNLEQWLEAERYYKTAHNMIPVKFTPLYKLMQLYIKNNDEETAIFIAKIIVNKKIKVSSNIILKIKNEAQHLINNSNTK